MSLSEETRKRQRKNPSPRYLRWSTHRSAMQDLKVNGYFCLRGAIPEELCDQCCCKIREDIGAKLDEGSPHQEEPIERLSSETVESMIKIRNYVLQNVFEKKVSIRTNSHV